MYTYFKDADVKLRDSSEQDFTSLEGLQRGVTDLGHFPTQYENGEGLLLHFHEQLEQLFD